MCENLRDLLYTSELSSGSVWGRDFDEDSDFNESESLDKARTLWENLNFLNNGKEAKLCDILSYYIQLRLEAIGQGATLQSSD